MSQSIDAAILAAQNAAAQYAGGMTVPAQPQAPAPMVPVTPGNPLTLNDVASGSLNVDFWLKVNEYGLTIGGKQGVLLPEIKVTIDTDRIQLFKGVRYGNPAKYKKSYDGLTVAAAGGSWAQALMDAAQIDPRASEYRGMDLVFTVVEDLVDAKKNVVVEAGKTLGYSTSITGWKNAEAFVRGLSALGLPLNERQIPKGMVSVTLGFEPQKNDKGQWGILTFNDVRVAS